MVKQGIFKLRHYQFCLLLAFAPFILSAGEARLNVIILDSHALKNNPLHDPSSRPVPVFSPAQATSGARLPVVYYLPDYGNSADKFIANSNVWLKFTQKIVDEITPIILVVVDGKTRWGGSQNLNSSAQENYENYVCDEIIPAGQFFHTGRESAPTFPAHAAEKLKNSPKPQAK